MTDLHQLKTESLDAITQISTVAEIEELRVSMLGKKGKITALMQGLKDMEPEARKTFGAEVNAVKTEVAQAIESKKQALETEILNQKLLSEKIDVTLPAAPKEVGKLHPLSYVTEEIEIILARMGFSAAKGPEIESDYYNFTALNIPEEHPARQDHDTFYLPDAEDGTKRVLRTQTSAVQIRTMEKHKAPLRVMGAGRVYRCDSDLTHTPQFHQVEGLALDVKGKITFAHLKGVLQQFMDSYFERHLNMRYRPSYFPFTEPSTEVDIECIFCSGKGCRVCKDTGWIEVLGAGMVHPNVLKAGGQNPDEVQGFAFGAGIERLAMLKYGINDLRFFFESHQSFLKHFGQSAVKIRR